MNTQVSYFKKILVVLMAVIMVFTYMPSMAWAETTDIGGNCGGDGTQPNVTWSFATDTKTLTISGFADTIVGNKKWDYKMPWSQYSNEVEHIIIETKIPAAVSQDIGLTLQCTFYDCSNLKSVHFSKGIKQVIASEAFSGCKKLETITFDDECDFSLGQLMFKDCTALKEISLPAGVKVGVASFADCTSLRKATVYQATSSAFAGCPALEEVIYPKGVTTFGNSTFNGCTRGGVQFAACTSLKKVSIPTTLTEWGTNPFPLETLENLEFVGDGTTNFYFDKNESGNGYKAIYNAGRTELYYFNPTVQGTVIIPKSITSLAENIFAECTGITKVEFETGSQLTQIPAGCFEGCTKLQEVVLPNTLETIGNSAFSGCTVLKTIKLPNSLISINAGAFSDCAALESIKLPEALQTIESSAFLNCVKFTELNLPTTVTRFGAQAIKGTSVREIILPEGITELNENQFNGCDSLEHIEIQGSVTKIPSNMINNCSALESVFLPATVQSIEKSSFGGDHFVIYFAGTSSQWRSQKMDPNDQKCKAGVICNYQKPTTEDGKLEVKSKSNKLVCDDAEEMANKNISMTLQYPDGETAVSDDKITADWYYTTYTPDGLKKLHPLEESDYSLDADSLMTTLNLKKQAEVNKFGTWNYVCVAFKKTTDNKITMTVSEPISVTLRDTSFTLKGTGSKEDPYQITKYDELKRIAERVEDGESFEDIYFALKTDDIIIPTDWQQIGTKETRFEGVFDGEDHTLTYAKGAKCLFSSVGSATIKNVQVQGEYIASAGLVDYIGPQKYGGKSGNVQNCKLLSGSTTLASGLIGNSGGVNVTNCEVQPNVKIGWDADTNQARAYGTVGSIVGGGAFNLLSCTSAADVTSKGNYVGGLAGYKGFSMRDCSIKNSQFSGSIHADGEYVGGILGGGYDDQTAPNTACAIIENCYVNADITGARAVGGILGGEGGCDQAWDNGIGYIRNNVFCGTLNLNGKDVVPSLPSQAVPADNINSSKGAISGFMRSLNKYNVIESNYYFITNVEGENGIGAVEHIDTSKIRPKGMKADGIYYYDTSKDSLKDICDWVDREDGIGREYSAVTRINHNRTDDPLGVDKDNLAKACTQKEMTDGTIVKLLNAHASSMHNWVQGENCPVLSDKAVAYKIEVSGDYQKEYYIGDKLDLSGIQFTVTWSDGTTTNPTLENGVTVTGFDSSKQAIVHLTAAYENATCDFTVKINKRADGTPTNPNTIKVNLTLLGDSLHGENGESHTLKNGGLTEWLPSKDYEVDLNATVWDFLQEVEKKATNPSVKFNAENSQYGMYISSVTYNGIELGQFDNGPLSGWMYTLNGKHPLLAVSEQFLKDGDKIVFHYTDDYTVEQGSEDWNTPGGGVVEEVKDVTTDTKAGTTTAPTEVKVSEKTNADGTKTKVADVKVSADNQKEILKQAKEKKSNEIILVVSSKSVGDAAKADVTLDKSFIDSIIKDTNAKLTIKTPFGDKTYTQDELKAMSEAATGSAVTVVIEKAAEEPTDDATAKIEKAKSIVKDMKLVARSSKTAKKNVKAVLKNDAKTKASIKELKDLGFTVRYRFYRSTKKAASYKSTVTKKTAAYTNTSGKKGTKYFYKVQVRVYDENGKLIAKTALKQCKYATRTWSKAK